MKNAQTRNFKETNTQIIFELKLGGRRAEKAREKLILENQGLVNKIAYTYYVKNSSLNLDDIKQSGQLGLIYAVDNFNMDPDQFSSYATLSINGYIKNFLREDKNISTSYRQDLKIKESQAAFEYSGDEPYCEDDSKVFKFESDNTTYLKPVRVNNKIGSEEGESLDRIENLKDETTGEEEIIDIIDNRIIIERLNKNLFLLNKKDRELISKIFGLGDYKEQTLTKIAEKEGVSKMAISLRKNRILDRLMKQMEK